MNVGILIIGNNDYLSEQKFCAGYISKQLSYKGYDVKAVMDVVADCDIKSTDEYLKSKVNAIIICGKTELFYEYLSQNYTIMKDLDVLEIEETIYIFMPESSNTDEKQEKFVSDKVLPALNSKTKTFYNTVIFKTIGKTEAELRELLKDFIRNKNRIAFRFVEDFPECEVQVKFSSKTQKPTVDNIISSVSALLNNITYANQNIRLAQQIADTLKIHDKKICIAESFTGGAISAEFVRIPGISASFKESVVAYSNDSKRNRLHLNEDVINTYGAVSIETVYEMAANILMQNPDCDICVATTGNAGPTAEKDGEQGLCFIAIGSKNGIHIYKYNIAGDRDTVIRHGTKYALFHLYKKLNESEFIELLRIHTQPKY